MIFDNGCKMTTHNDFKATEICWYADHNARRPCVIRQELDHIILSQKDAL